VTTGADGMLEIRHGPGDQEDPDQIKVQPISDANAGELAAGKAYEARLAVSIAPSPRTSDRGPASLRGLQALMTSHYRRR
jgi:hypothetical protein